MLFIADPAVAQRTITADSPATESFNIGTTATASLPADFRADKVDTVRTTGTWAAAGTSTERLGGTNNFTNSGIYNFGAGDPASANDRAVGFLSSTTGVKSGNLYGSFVAAPGISSFTVSYNVEKYRNGTNSAGFTMQLLYSKDGQTYTSAGTSFQTSFAADADSNVFSSPPGMTRHVTGTIDLSAMINAASAIASDRQFYLAWNYSVSSGTETANAQALGIDDISVAAAAPEPGATLLAGLGAVFVCGQRRRRRRWSIVPASFTEV